VTAKIRAPRGRFGAWTAALFLWHQTAFVTVSSLGLLGGRVPGLLTAPTGSLWVAERLAWLPVIAIVLSGQWLAFHRVERSLTGVA